MLIAKITLTSGKVLEFNKDKVLDAEWAAIIKPSPQNWVKIGTPDAGYIAFNWQFVVCVEISNKTKE